jgi:predicted glutamine amidotransferase
MISKATAGFSYKDKQLFSQMLYADALRGEDSTGVYGVNKHGNLKMIKAAQKAATFLESKTYKDFESDILTDFRMVVGHNRAATKGAKSDANAHPFIEDHICLVHNGTLHSHRHLGDKDVDSHAICESMAKRGMEETIPDLHGAFALIWYDAKKKTLFITRNKERPLWLLDTETAIYIASEPGMLQWLYFRVYGKLEKTAYFAEDKIYSWELGQEGKVFTAEPAPKKKFQPITTVFSNNTSKTSKAATITITKGKSYQYGEAVIFEHEENSVFNGQATFVGKSWDAREARVVGHMNIDGMDTKKVSFLLDTTEYFIGTVYGFSSKQGVESVLVRDIRPYTIYTTSNGEGITEDQMNASDYTCSCCGGWIDPDEQNGMFWARIRNGVVKKLICSDCVDTQPNLQGKDYKAWKQYNESLSSPISSDQTQQSNSSNILEEIYPSRY